MHAEVQNLFIRIHMLHQATQHKLTINDMQPILESHGYRVGDREVKQELEHLTTENMLTANGEEYMITGTGIGELKEIRKRLTMLCSEVVSHQTGNLSDRTRSEKKSSVVV
ncbi:hypothetical protein [Paenibacillus wulumuqiensis]|uniref:hypothetical protein n=1 Tax=Paenibacillus wulumuqiensis TaxID=1567107 RepID=UPI00061986E7|nr:hypothetical protein [Paenibacillus wulumuqiensis]